MIARAPTRCGSRSVIHGGPRGDDQRVVAPGGHLRKAEHQIGMDIGSCHGDHWGLHTRGFRGAGAFVVTSRVIEVTRQDRLCDNAART